MRQPYRMLGLILLMAGVIFAPVCYFIIDSTALTSVGITMLILGLTCVALANTRPYISPEASQVMLKTGMENTAALLEELGLRNKAIYLPSYLRDGRPQAIIPLVDVDGHLSEIRGTIPGRLVVRYGSGPDDMAIAVTTPGSINLEMLETPPGTTTTELESAISYILTGVLDIAASVSVSLQDNLVSVDVRNPRLHWENIWYYRALGSPLASIAAAICCEGLGKPIRIDKETSTKGKTHIELEVLA
jgi:hypothetical protein